MNYQALDTADQSAIQNLFSYYGYLVDDANIDGWLALFSEDARFEIPGMATWEGDEGIRTVGNMVAEGSKGKWRHQLTNVLAEPGPTAGTAKARMNGLVSDWSVEPPNLSFMDYTAELRKIGGHWKITRIIAVPSKVTV